jgi:hypothetical protein
MKTYLVCIIGETLSGNSGFHFSFKSTLNYQVGDEIVSERKGEFNQRKFTIHRHSPKENNIIELHVI